MAADAVSVRRIAGIMRRHLYLLRRSWPRVVELIYPPTLQLVLWVFLTRYLGSQSDSLANAAGMFLSAVLLWHVVARAQRSVSEMFMEEVRSRHFGYLFASPLRVHELMIALFLSSVMRILIGVGGAVVFAWFLQRFSIVDTLGWPLIAFFSNLMWFGWSVAMVIAALLLRLGLGANGVTGFVVLMLQPLSAVYYPVVTLPDWLQQVSWCLPSAAIFEGMRALVLDDSFRSDLLLHAVLLNLAWTALATLIFVLSFRSAQTHGLLLQVGE